jgi:hypothetical protein
MIGTAVSHRAILENPGGGGTGMVYQAQDIRLSRDEAATTHLAHVGQISSAPQNPFCLHTLSSTTRVGRRFV